MIKIFKRISLAGVLFGLIGVTGFVIAQNVEQSLTDKQEEALRNYAAALTVEPPQVIMSVTLVPPNTDYIAQFKDGEETLESARVKQILGSQEGIFGIGDIQSSMTFSYADEWQTELSCGTWSKSNYYGGMRWGHPNTGDSSGCPHKDGVAHEGVVTLRGSYSFHLSMFNSQREGVNLLEAKYSFTCTHQGSESAVEECDERLVSWSGRYGSMVSPPANSASESALKSKSGDNAVKVGIAVGIAIAGGAAWLLSRQIKKKKLPE